MTDELDPKLKALFAQSRAEIRDDDFTLRTVLQVQAAMRRQRFWRVAGLSAFLAVIAAAIPSMEVPITAACAWMDGHADFMVSPMGWAVSIAIGLIVLRRARVFG